MISQSNNFGFGFKTLKWKPLYLNQSVNRHALPLISNFETVTTLCTNHAQIEPKLLPSLHMQFEDTMNAYVYTEEIAPTEISFTSSILV